MTQALLSFHRQDVERGKAPAQQALALFQQIGQPYGIALSWNYLGDAARMNGEYAAAAIHYETALTLLRQAAIKSEIPAVLHNLGNLALAQGDLPRATELFREGLSIHHTTANSSGIAECLVGLAAVAIAQQQPQAAAMLLAAVEQMTEKLDMPLPAQEQAVVATTVAAVRQRLSEDEWRMASAQARNLTPMQVAALLH